MDEIPREYEEAAMIDGSTPRIPGTGRPLTGPRAMARADEGGCLTRAELQTRNL
jgi:hypothetical protein